MTHRSAQRVIELTRHHSSNFPHSPSSQRVQAGWGCRQSENKTLEGMYGSRQKGEANMGSTER